MRVSELVVKKSGIRIRGRVFITLLLFAQMCFLKGRVTDKHTEKHQMMEFCSSSKGQKSWHSRLLGTGSRARGGRVWNELKSSFIYSPRSSVSR